MDESPDLDRDVNESMRLFQQAHVGSANPLTPIRPARVMLVLDGSDQDTAAIAAASHLRETYNTETLVLDARDGDRADPIALEATKQFSGAREIERSEGEAFEAILSSLAKHDVHLLIVPCPFGRAFERVGGDSVGTVIDVMLSRCRIPFLIIRSPEQQLSEASKRISVLVAGECDVETRAAAWAFGLAKSETELSLNLVVEKEHFENVRSLIEAMQPGQKFDVETLSDVLAKTHQSLHASMSKTAHETGVRYHLQPQSGEAAPPTLSTQTDQQLIVLPLEVDDRFTQGFVIDRIRRSPHPVLVVPGHVPQD